MMPADEGGPAQPGWRKRRKRRQERREERREDAAAEAEEDESRDGSRDGGGGGKADDTKGKGKGADPKGADIDWEDPAGRQKVIALEYGWSMALLDSDPELRELFEEAVKATWTTERFTAELRDTNWFQDHSAQQRQAILLRTTDPAQFQTQLNIAISDVRDTWGALMGPTGLDDERATRLATHALMLGWSSAQLRDRMVESTNFMKMLRHDELGGTSAQTLSQINAYAGQFGVKVGREWKAKQLERIVGGEDTIDGTLNRLKEIAKSKYGAFRDELDAGRTMSEIADPYLQAKAALLEMNPGQMDVMDKDIQRALQNKGEKGNHQPLTLEDFEDRMRKDDRWQYTQNARDQVMQIGTQLAQAFGLVG